jgi:hypothetical protein
MNENTLPENGANGLDPRNEKLLRAAVSLNTSLLALVFGAISGLSLFVMTYLSMYRGLPKPGQFLNLLGVFLPGYHVSHSGAWFGLFWAALVGGLLAAMFYRIYARSIPAQVQEYLLSGRSDNGDLMSVTLRFDGNYLGLALGSIIALGLFITTSWLVFRGTAEESYHAVLLSHYLPGYNVSYAGALVGAIELFGVVFMLCQLFSWIYNSVARSRGRKPR